MIEPTTGLTLLSMACITYCTRICGYLLLRDRPLSPRARAVVEAAPGCVLISVIAPHFVSPSPAHLADLGATILAATRLSMLSTVAVAVVSAALLRQILP